METELRRRALLALVAGLSVAGLVAIVALLSGSWDDTDWRVVGSSLGFSVFTATAAAGAAFRESWIGRLAVGASAVAYLALLVALWIIDDGDGAWQTFGTAGLVALWSSHASLMLRPLRSTDSAGVRQLTWTSVITLGIDTFVGVLAILGLADDFDFDGGANVLAALIVVTVVSTAIVPVLRRLGRDEPLTPTARPLREIAADISAVADRLPPEQGDRLRELARELSSSR